MGVFYTLRYGKRHYHLKRGFALFQIRQLWMAMIIRGDRLFCAGVPRLASGLVGGDHKLHRKTELQSCRGATSYQVIPCQYHFLMQRGVKCDVSFAFGSVGA